MTSQKLDKELKKKIKAYVKIHNALDHSNSFQVVFSKLHPSLRQDCQYSITAHFLSLIGSVTDLPIGVKRHLATHVKEKLFIAGDRIVTRGEIVDVLYYVTSGEVAQITPSNTDTLTTRPSICSLK